MSNYVGTLQNQTLFHNQIDFIVQAYHRWHLGFNDVRIGIPTPNGAYNGGSYELMQDIPTIDDALTKIKYNDQTAFQQSDLSLQIENIANQFFWSQAIEEGIDYNIVIFTGSEDATEIAAATKQRQALLDSFRTRVIVISLFPKTQPQEELQDLQNGGLIDINDINFYFTLTNDICNGDVVGDPSDIPTALPVPAYPGNIDIFVQFSANGCPNPVNLYSQIVAIRQLFQNYTFEEEGVRAAIPNPIGMSSAGNDILLYNKESVLKTIQTIESFSKLPNFCSSGVTLTNTLKNIQNLLRVKTNSSAAMILFSDSTDSADIAVAADYRQKNLDPIRFLLLPVQLPGGASLSPLATNKNQTFNINDYNLNIEITEALENAQPFLNATQI
jgi:hypothetical protein